MSNEQQVIVTTITVITKNPSITTWEKLKELSSKAAALKGIPNVKVSSDVYRIS